MPNSLAYLALLAWPPVTLLLFARLPIGRALVWSMLGGYLLLPPVAAFDFPLIPPFDKYSITSLSALLGCAIRGEWLSPLPETPLARLLVVVFVLAPIPTVLTNGDPLVFPLSTIGGLRVHDALAAVVGQAIAILPFLLARQVLATEASHREILVVLVLAGLGYSLPMLVEIRLSPQLNTWIYGFFQHDFIQMVRYGGYRPMVFLQHGLWAAFFAFMTFLAAVGLWRSSPAAERRRWLIAGGYLGLILFLCKSMAALIYGAVLAPVVAILSPRTQMRLAVLLAAVAVAYPLLRGADLVPVDAMVTRIEAFDQDRAASLRFRFNNEGELLARARERPLFGWGGWGRNVIRDPVTGRETSVNDGRWIIVIGISGWVGYLAEFGLLSLATVMVARRSARMPAREASAAAGTLALILGANMIDMLPNATLIPFTWLVAGALVGYAEALAAGRQPARVAPPEPAVPPPPRTVL